MKGHFPVKEQLHTDILEQKYGPIHSEVLRHDSIREARLVDQNNILRTYALTFLTYDRSNNEISNIDQEIKNGGLIGKTFKEHGYVVKKNVVDVFIIDLPEWMKKDFQTKFSQAKARITEFYAKKNQEVPVVYGEVLEIYSPDFKDPSEGVNDIDRAQINPLTETLKEVGINENDIWLKIDRAGELNEWSDLKDQYEKAQKASVSLVEDLQSKIKSYLKERQ